MANGNGNGNKWHETAWLKVVLAVLALAGGSTGVVSLKGQTTTSDSLNVVTREMDKRDIRISKVEDTVGTLKDQVAILNEKTTNIENDVNEMQDKMDILNDRQIRQDVKLDNIVELLSKMAKDSAG